MDTSLVRRAACLVLLAALALPAAVRADPRSEERALVLLEGILGLVGVDLASVAGDRAEETTGMPAAGTCDTAIQVDPSGSSGFLSVECSSSAAGDLSGLVLTCGASGDPDELAWTITCGGSAPFGSVGLTGQAHASPVASEIVPEEWFYRLDAMAVAGATSEWLESDGFLRPLRHRGREVSEGRGLSLQLSTEGELHAKRQSVLEVEAGRTGGSFSLRETAIFPDGGEARVVSLEGRRLLDATLREWRGLLTIEGVD